MSVANLTRYSCKVVDSGSHQYTGMVPWCLGEYVKFEEAMEASSNSLQQLKAEIVALQKELSCYRNRARFVKETKIYDCY